MLWQRRAIVVLLVLAGLWCSGSAAPARADFPELLAKLPRSTNVLVMLNAEQIFASDVATRDRWKQRYEATYADSPLLLPPSGQQFVLAAELDLAYLKPRSQVVVMRLAEDPSMSLIARTIRGQRDTLAGLEAVATPRDALIVKFGPHVFGMMQPGDRQAAARWIRGVSSNNAILLSPYLEAAASVPDRVGTEIIMAIDLTDALSRQRVRQALAKSKVLADKSIDLDAAADVLTSIRGATLGVRVTRRVFGKLKVDFATDADVLADVGKPLLLEILGEAGATIDEFSDWKAGAGPRQITIEGELTRSGLRRLFSFLDIDATAVVAPQDADQPEASGSEPAADPYTSLEYFQSVTRYLEDLKRQRGASSYYTIAVWFDKYAKRIDRLPILNVDPELVDYGGRVVSGLRDCVEAIRGSGIRSGTRSAQVTGGYGGYGDDYGYGSYRVFSSSANYAAAQVSAVEQERRAIRAQERGQSSTDVRAIIRQIEEETSKIRRQMTERYNMDFGKAPSR